MWTGIVFLKKERKIFRRHSNKWKSCNFSGISPAPRPPDGAFFSAGDPADFPLVELDFSVDGLFHASRLEIR